MFAVPFAQAGQPTGPVGLTAWPWSRSVTQTSQAFLWISWLTQQRQVCRQLPGSQGISLGWVGFGCHRGGSWRWEHDQSPVNQSTLNPGAPEDGWQHEVASRVEETFRAEDLFARMDDPSKALLRSQ